MMYRTLKSYNLNMLVWVTVFLILTDLAIILDAQIIRLIFGFALIYIFPGMMILHILGSNKLGNTERFVLSAGLSISFLMFFGLLINNFYSLIGYDKPLSRNSFVILFNIILMLLALISSSKNKFFSLNLYDLEPSTREKAFLLLPSFFPLLSILGMHLMNTTDSNIMPIVLLFLIPAYAIFIAVIHDNVPERVYPAIIFLCSLSLILLLGLRSDHIIGVDIHSEFHIFQQTVSNAQWNKYSNSILDSCLSISILPTAYNFFVDVDPEYLFKVLYPVLFSISPLVVYIISKKYISNFYAFLSSLFFMSQSGFLLSASICRTVIAILFFALSVMVIFSERLNTLEKRMLFIIFAASSIISHYSTSLAFFFIMLLTYLSLTLLYLIISLFKKDTVVLVNIPASHKLKALAFEDLQNSLKSSATAGIIVLFFVIIFLWYSQVTGVVFDTSVGYISNSLRSLQDFFIFESRSESIIKFAGGSYDKSIPLMIQLVFSWLVIFLVAIGVLSSIYGYFYKIAFANRDIHLLSIFSDQIDSDFCVLSIACSSMLAITVAVPFIYKGYGMEKFYLQMMIVLSPFFVIGGATIAQYLHFRWKYLVVLAILIPYFMSNSGIMHQIFGEANEITLNSKGDSYDMLFVHDEETIAARWLKESASNDLDIFTDFLGGTKLVSQAGLVSSKYPKQFIEDGDNLGSGYIYLRYPSVVDGKLRDSQSKWRNITDYSIEFAKRGLIYANGGSEVLL